MPRRPVTVLAALALAGTACRAPSAVDASRSLRAASVRTVAIEPTCTVFSPYDAVRTQGYVERVVATLGLVGDVFEAELPGPLYVVLELEEASKLRADGDASVAGTPAPHGVLGAYGRLDGESPSVLLFVPRDGELVLEDGRTVAVRYDRDPGTTLRHEIAHVFADQLGLDGDTWFDEGLALELESMQPVRGQLVPVALPETIEVARRLPRVPMTSLLDWSERGARVLSGAEEAFVEGRPLAHALVRFLLLREEQGSLVERLRAVKELGRDELLAVEEAWHAWLDAPTGRRVPWDRRR